MTSLPPLPPLAALRACEATARRLSVQGAADELRVTPSAVSHRLRNLEGALGVKLFHRLNRRLVLTDAGAVYLSRVAPAFRSEEHTSELQSLMRISYAVFRLKNKKKALSS